VTGYVIDASVAIKWFVTEKGTDQAISLLEAHRLAAPDLLIVECANILWKKVRRAEMSPEAALLTARVLERMEVELVPMRALIGLSLELAIEFDHPAYDCAYLALAAMQACAFVTADERLVKKASRDRGSRHGISVLSLSDAVVQSRG
jgi:predicted nucleic acid-binding protein